MDNPLPSSQSEHPRPPLAELVKAFASIGIFSFGGATAQIAMLHRIAVEERQWLDEARYVRALNLCMLLPGPEAQQLATYIGWHARGTLGGIVAGSLFVLPGALCMLALSFLYVLGTGTTIIDGIFFGIKAAVLAIVAQAVIKLSKRALKTPRMIALAVAAFLGFALLNAPFPLVILAAALLGLWLADAPAVTHVPAMSAQQKATRRRDTAVAAVGGLTAWLAPIGLAALLLGSGHVIVDLALFFAKLAMLTFGGAYALLAWLTDAAVANGWVTTREMISGLGLAETTPGPTILVTQFVGFIGGYKAPGSLPPLVSATVAALLTTWVTFAPSFLWIFTAAPWLDELVKNRRVSQVLSGITAAVVGAIAWLALWFGLNTMFRQATFLDLGLVRLPFARLADLDPAATGLTLLSFVLIFVLKRGMLETIGLLALLGMVWTVLT
jgi:chromate transporter